MRVKIARRLYKLGGTVPDLVLREVQAAGEAAEVLLQERWLMVQKEQAASPRWAPDELNVPGDTRLTLSQSHLFNSQVLLDSSVFAPPKEFDPRHSKRFHEFDAFCKNNHSEIFGTNSLIPLVDFELAVQNDLDDWVSKNSGDIDDCSKIAACITQYSDAALIHYKSNPENQSLMFLTIFELWVALDTMAIAQCPLLKDYSPEVPLTLFEPLLLRRSKDFHRLAASRNISINATMMPFPGDLFFLQRWMNTRLLSASSRHLCLISPYKYKLRQMRGWSDSRSCRSLR